MKRYDIRVDENGTDGWFGGRPPGILPDQWPRSRNTGLPMVHALTLRLPEEYQRRGPQYPGIALFQAHDVEASPVRGLAKILEGKKELSAKQKDDPFFVEIAKASQARHPMEKVWTDDDIGFALLWLTDEELTGKEASLPEEVQHEDDDDNPSAWDSEAEKQSIALEVKDDPNAGKPPRDMTSLELETEPHIDEPQKEYVPYFCLSERLQALVGYAQNHLGGTLTPPGNLTLPKGITPWVLELGEEGGMNLAGGALILDLEKQKVLWSAG